MPLSLPNGRALNTLARRLLLADLVDQPVLALAAQRDVEEAVAGLALGDLRLHLDGAVGDVRDLVDPDGLTLELGRRRPAVLDGIRGRGPVERGRRRAVRPPAAGDVPQRGGG